MISWPMTTLIPRAHEVTFQGNATVVPPWSIVQQ